MEKPVLFAPTVRTLERSLETVGALLLPALGLFYQRSDSTLPLAQGMALG